MPSYVFCNLCGNDETKILEEAEEPYKVVKCKLCGLVYVNPQPDKEELINSYSKEYYSEWISLQRKSRLRLWRRRLKGLEKYKKRGKILDVGCGVGTFLDIAKKNGWEVYGTEISECGCRYAQENFNLDAFHGELKEANFSDNLFDVVTLWHVIEHLTNPLKTLREVRRILKKDGLLVVATPNIGNYIMRILYPLVRRKRLKLFSIDDKELHLYHFSTETIQKAIEKAGFKIVNIGFGLSATVLTKELMDYIANFVWSIFRINIGSEIKVYCIDY